MVAGDDRDCKDERGVAQPRLLCCYYFPAHTLDKDDPLVHFSPSEDKIVLPLR